MSRLAGKVAIVTGASSGIGAATARALAQNGVHVVLAARRFERIQQLSVELTTSFGVRTLAVTTDVSKREQIVALVERAHMTFGRIDILINNAGLGLQGDVADLHEPDLRYLFDVNVFGVVDAMQAVIPIMRQQGGGTIVNISSILGKVALPSLGMVGSSAGYTASKFAVQAFSAAARMELAGENIRIVTVLPGVTASEFNDSFLRGTSPGAIRKVRRTGSLMGVVPPEKVAQRIVKAVERSDREVYITLKDRLFVWGANLAPGLFEWAMVRFRKSRIGT